MIPILIGILSGIILILFIGMLKKFSKVIMYGLILTAIGFIYIGFTWSDFVSLFISSLQAILFVFISYYGITKRITIIAIGYFLHGIWDILYGYFLTSDLIPPGYNLFCLSIDFTIGIYLLSLKEVDKQSTL